MIRVVSLVSILLYYVDFYIFKNAILLIPFVKRTCILNILESHGICYLLHSPIITVCENVHQNRKGMLHRIIVNDG